jgi:hypothetical protein
MQSLDAVFYAENGPTFEFRSGMFHICYDIRGTHIELVVPPHAFMRAIRDANRLIDDFNERKPLLSLRGDAEVAEH